MNEKEVEKRETEAESTLEEATKYFEQQFGVGLECTAFKYVDEMEDGIIFSQEYFIYNLVISKIDELDIGISGWFKYDDRSDEPLVSCILNVAVIINGRVVGESELLGEYNKQIKRWTLK